jgi:hypothetical protein
MAEREIITWLTARSRLEDAEEKLLEMLSNAERLAKSLKDWPSVRPTDDSSKQYPGAMALFEVYSWPDSVLINDTLKECHAAQRALDEADAGLTERDRKLLKPVKPAPD